MSKKCLWRKVNMSKMCDMHNLPNNYENKYYNNYHNSKKEE